MSIDGPGIIESDAAHDVYNELLDLYDGGADVSELLRRIDEQRESFNVDVIEEEIVLVAAAQALWEIGHLPDELLAEVTTWVESERSLKEWEQEDSDLAKKRGAVLRRFIAKIGIPRAKPRARKRYKKVTNLAASVGDCLAKRLDDGTIACFVVLGIDQYRGGCNYKLGYADVDGDSRVDVVPARILVRRISTATLDDPTGTIIGFVVARVEHANMVAWSPQLPKVATIDIGGGPLQMGSVGFVRSLDELEQEYVRNMSDAKAPIAPTPPDNGFAELFDKELAGRPEAEKFKQLFRSVAEQSMRRNELVLLSEALA